MLRGRLVSLKGIDARDFKAPDDAQWVLRGDRGITYSATLPENSTLVEGNWWPADYSGKNLVSFDAELARQMGLAIGDTIEVNVLGRTILAEIHNLRRVEWQSLAINFVMVFSPNTFAGAPHSHLATLSLDPQGKESAEEVSRRESGIMGTRSIRSMIWCASWPGACGRRLRWPLLRPFWCWLGPWLPGRGNASMMRSSSRRSGQRAARCCWPIRWNIVCWG
jgi:antitoxin component of MazEF toxin-antitoxin module